MSCSPRTPAAQASPTSTTLPRVPTARHKLRVEPKSPTVSFGEDGLGFFFFWMDGWTVKEQTLPSPLLNYASGQAAWASWKVKAAAPAPVPFHSFGGGSRPGLYTRRRRQAKGAQRVAAAAPVSPPLQACDPLLQGPLYSP